VAVHRACHSLSRCLVVRVGPSCRGDSCLVGEEGRRTSTSTGNSRRRCGNLSLWVWLVRGWKRAGLTSSEYTLLCMRHVRLRVIHLEAGRSVWKLTRSGTCRRCVVLPDSVYSRIRRDWHARYLARRSRHSAAALHWLRRHRRPSDYTRPSSLIPALTLRSHQVFYETLILLILSFGFCLLIGYLV